MALAPIMVSSAACDPIMEALVASSNADVWAALLTGCSTTPTAPSINAKHIFRALEESDIVALAAMAKHAPNIVVSARTPEGLNALHVAVLDDILAAVEVLAPLCGGALMSATVAAPAMEPQLHEFQCCGDARDWSRGRSALPTRYADASAFVWAVIMSRTRVLPALLEAGADARMLLTEPRAPLLTLAPLRAVRVLASVVRPGAPLVLRVPTGSSDWGTALHVAAAHLQTKRMRALLRHDPSAASTAPALLRSATPLHWIGRGSRCGVDLGRSATVPLPGARWAAAASIVSALLSAGASVDVVDDEGNTPLSAAISRFDVAVAAALWVHAREDAVEAAGSTLVSRCSGTGSASALRRPTVSIERDVIVNVFKHNTAQALAQRLLSLPRCSNCSSAQTASDDDANAAAQGEQAAFARVSVQHVMNAWHENVVPLPTCVVGALVHDASRQCAVQDHTA